MSDLVKLVKVDPINAEVATLAVDMGWDTVEELIAELVRNDFDITKTYLPGDEEEAPFELEEVGSDDVDVVVAVLMGDASGNRWYHMCPPLWQDKDGAYWVDNNDVC